MLATDTKTSTLLGLLDPAFSTEPRVTDAVIESLVWSGGIAALLLVSARKAQWKCTMVIDDVFCFFIVVVDLESHLLASVRTYEVNALLSFVVIVIY